MSTDLRWKRNRISETVFENGTAKILLQDGTYAIIDEEDFELVSNESWAANASRNRPVATAVRSTKRRMFLHRLIMNARPEQMIDHINGDIRDNRRSNLRLCTYSENSRNFRKTSGLSRFKGVDLHKKSGTWRARIYIAPKQILLGKFKTEREAAEAYDRAAKLHYGEFAATNKDLGLLD